MLDPRSRLRAKIEGWSRPVTWEEIHAMDLFDITAARYLPRGKFKPLPRPWQVRRKVNATAKKRSAREIYARLRPGKPLPT